MLKLQKTINSNFEVLNSEFCRALCMRRLLEILTIGYHFQAKWIMKAEFCRALCMTRLPGILTKGYHIFSSQMDY